MWPLCRLGGLVSGRPFAAMANVLARTNCSRFVSVVNRIPRLQGPGGRKQDLVLRQCAFVSPVALSAYNLFVKDHSGLYKTHPDLNHRAISSLIGEERRRLTEEEKEHYIREQILDAARRRSSSREVNDRYKSSRSVMTRNRWHAFTSEQLPVIRKENPNKGFGDQMAVVAEKWMQLTVEEKKEYEEKARKDHAASSHRLSEQAAKNGRMTICKELQPTFNGRALFRKSCMSEILKNHPGTPLKQLSPLSDNRWKELSPEKKAQYKADAKKEKEKILSQLSDDERALTMSCLKKIRSSGYGLFVKEQFPLLSQEDTWRSHGEIHVAVGERWSQLSDEEKLHYKNEAAAIRMDGLSQLPDQLIRFKFKTGGHLFRKEECSRLLRENPNLSTAEVNTLVVRNWQSLTIEEKKQFYERAKMFDY